MTRAAAQPDPVRVEALELRVALDGDVEGRERDPRAQLGPFEIEAGRMEEGGDLDPLERVADSGAARERAGRERDCDPSPELPGARARIAQSSPISAV